MTMTELALFELLRESPGIWSNEDLANRLKLGKSTVNRGLHGLRAAGILEVSVRRRSFKNHWSVQRTLNVKNRLENS